MIGTRNIIALVGGVALIALGFYTLAKGSMTLAPTLLVIGYCVAIPLAIMMRRPDEGEGEEDERANSSAG